MNVGFIEITDWNWWENPQGPIWELNRTRSTDTILAPNLLQAQLWLWEKHEVWVTPVTEIKSVEDGTLHFRFVIDGAFERTSLRRFDEPTEALDLGIRAACEWIEKQSKSIPIAAHAG